MHGCRAQCPAAVIEYNNERMNMSPRRTDAVNAVGAEAFRAAKARPQMEDIAQLAGVSTATVSRALNKSPLVHADTRERIEQLARSLRYSVNAGASNLRLRRNRTVGVVMPIDGSTRPDVGDPEVVGLIGGLADALAVRGYDMLIARFDAARLDLAGDLAGSGRVIGLIVMGQWQPEEQLTVLAARQLPVVIWGAHRPRQTYCTVGGDNIAGGTLATEHLIASGRRRIAFLGELASREVEHRHEGYLQVIAREKLVPSAHWVPAAPGHARPARAAVESFAAQATAFDGLFASSDALALEAMVALRDRGIRVPEDIAVMGYGDIYAARYAHPALSTIRQPLASGAEAAVEAVLKLVDGRRLKSQMLQPELIVRAST
jgi:DNA-binding LacI/PurR family transcriptional regulator